MQSGRGGFLEKKFGIFFWNVLKTFFCQNVKRSKQAASAVNWAENIIDSWAAPPLSFPIQLLSQFFVTYPWKRRVFHILFWIVNHGQVNKSSLKMTCFKLPGRVFVFSHSRELQPPVWEWV
jgi:hypothetical protein